MGWSRAAHARDDGATTLTLTPELDVEKLLPPVSHSAGGLYAQVIGASKLNNSSSDSSKNDTLLLGLFWMVCIACAMSQLSVNARLSCRPRVFTCLMQGLCKSADQSLFGIRWSLHGVLAQEAGILYRLPEYAALFLGCRLLPAGCVHVYTACVWCCRQFCTPQPQPRAAVVLSHSVPLWPIHLAIWSDRYLTRGASVVAPVSGPMYAGSGQATRPARWETALPRRTATLQALLTAPGWWL